MMKRFLLLLMTFFLTAALMSCAGSQAFQRGERYSHSGEWDMAVKEYREANRKSPQDIEYRSALIRAEETAANQHYKKAKSFLKERKLDQAITELQQAIYLNPTNAAIQGALRSVLDMKQAEEHYRASLTFMELGRIGEAINELNQAVELDPDNTKYTASLEKIRKEKTEVEPKKRSPLLRTNPLP
jgi:tetratricopeptide (TPR) repeat protein